MEPSADRGGRATTGGSPPPMSSSRSSPTALWRAGSWRMMRPEWGRRSGRLKGLDYTTPGLYFVTICTRERAGVLGDLHAGSSVRSPIGEIVRQTWAEIPGHSPNVDLDEYVVMPNHLHGLLCIVDVTVGAQHPAPAGLGRGAAPRRQPPQRPTRPRVIPGSLGAIVRTFKSASTRRANLRSGTPRRLVLAAQLLRTRHPRRRRPKPRSCIYQREPPTVGSGQGKPSAILRLACLPTT